MGYAVRGWSVDWSIESGEGEWWQPEYVAGMPGARAYRFLITKSRHLLLITQETIENMLRWTWISALVIVLDLATKWLASSYLVLHEPVAIMPMFNLTLMHNTGAAFSFLSSAAGWQRWFFSIIALVVSIGIVVWMRRLPAQERWSAIALALILGGALGNLWDRVTLGYVVDFIQIYYEQWAWPAFNIADSAISIGAVMLVIDALRAHRRERSAQNS